MNDQKCRRATIQRILTLAIAAAFATLTQAADKTMQKEAEKIAASIVAEDVARVVVLPFMYETDSTSPADRSPSRDLAVSLPARLYIENFETLLSEASAGRYRVMPSADLIEAFAKNEVLASSLSPTSSTLNRIIGDTGRDVDAVVIGYADKKTIELQGSDFTLNESTDIAWKLLDLRDGTFITSATQNRISSFADAVYNGLSGEFFRWQGNTLKVLLDHESTDRARIPMSPREAAGKYTNRNSHLNPLFNINCPYKVAFDVEGNQQPLKIPVGKFRPWSQSAPENALANDFGGTAYLPIEPGENLVVRMRNTTQQTARVAMFVDGVNILGKRRELPNDGCQAWVVKPGKSAVFSGFYSNWTTDPQVETFELASWKDSVAAALGVAQSAQTARTITIVVFTEGPVSRGTLRLNPRFKSYAESHWWDPDRRSVWVTGEYEEIAAAGQPGFGMRGRQSVKAPLNLTQAKKPGVILAAMTVLYRTAAEISAEEQRFKENPNFDRFVSAGTTGFE
jgi:hypothetical protein